MNIKENWLVWCDELGVTKENWKCINNTGRTDTHKAAKTFIQSILDNSSIEQKESIINRLLKSGFSVSVGFFSSVDTDNEEFSFTEIIVGAHQKIILDARYKIFSVLREASHNEEIFELENDEK